MGSNEGLVIAVFLEIWKNKMNQKWSTATGGDNYPFLWDGLANKAAI